MIELTLEVTGAQAGSLDQAGTSRRFRFTESGGTIGRAPGGATHWMLPDGMVSSMHAAISYAAGAFQIEDRKSTNGVVLNGVHLTVGRTYPLHDGDVLVIDPYTIEVTVTGMPRAASPARAPVDGPLTSGQILDQFSGVWQAPVSAGEQQRLDQAPAIHDFVATPRPDLAPRVESSQAPRPIPRGYNPAESIFGKTESEACQPAAPPVTPSPRAGSGESAPPQPSQEREADVEAPPVARPRRAEPREPGIRDLLAAAGIPGVPITPELANEMGTILKILAQGLVDVLRTRQEVKTEFDVEHTVPGLQRNNPFKLARTGTQALEALFAKRQAAFLDPVDAVRDSFDDLRQHHVAMSAGIRAAFDAMLAEFSPDRLEQRFSRRASGAILPLPGKVRHWDAYRERFDELVNDDPDDVFRRLFGDAFSAAYTSQLKSLRPRRGEEDA